jgi:hypothetical protein
MRKNKLKIFISCVLLSFGLFGFSVSATNVEETAYNCAYSAAIDAGCNQFAAAEIAKEFVYKLMNNHDDSVTIKQVRTFKYDGIPRLIATDFEFQSAVLGKTMIVTYVDEVG